MKHLKPFLTYGFIIGLLINNSCAWAAKTNDSKSDIVLVACTPGDSLIKSHLSIPSEIIIDFIRWELTLNQTVEKQAFVLNIQFGESQPNTLGFKSGGHKKTFEGEFSISNDNSERISGDIYHLKSRQFTQEISMVRLNDNLFHLLTPENQLIVGNGGWSYTLNNKQPVKTDNKLPVLPDLSASIIDTYIQVIYDGRTPCQDFAAEHNMNVNESCFKLKWKLILNRDSVSHNPTTYTIRKVIDNMPRDLTGKWTVIKGTPSNPDALIYQLDPDIPAQTISLLVGDENILFFLDKDKELFVGNNNFSFTLNRRMK